LARKRMYAEGLGLQVPMTLTHHRPVTSSGKAAPGPDPRIRHRIQIGMFRPIRVDHTNCLQVAIKTHSCSSTTRYNHNSTTRALSPSEYLVSLYSSYFHFRLCNSNFLSMQVMLPPNVPSLQIQKCPVCVLLGCSCSSISSIWV
jgi:hypothetical protein